MNETSGFAEYDRLRAWAEGTLSASERARFESEVANDPDLARRAAEFGDVWKATSGALNFLGQPAPSRMSFEDLMQHARPVESPRRRVAAAALIGASIVAAAALAWVAWTALASRSDGNSNRVVLHAIPSERPHVGGPIDDNQTAIPAFLARWSPVEGSTIRWLGSLDDARAASAIVDRPLFVYGYVPGCPLCEELNETTFHDPEVTSLVERSVPVAIDLSKLAPEEMQTLYARRYPLLEIQDARGGILRTFAGTFLDVDVRAELDAALPGAPAFAWTLVRDLASTLAQARDDETRGDLASAALAFERLRERREAPAFEREGERGVGRIAEAARVALDTARVHSSSPDAREALEHEARRFAGTPFEPDFTAVLDAWRTSGHFPVLVSEPR